MLQQRVMSDGAHHNGAVESMLTPVVSCGPLLVGLEPVVAIGRVGHLACDYTVGQSTEGLQSEVQ